MHIFADPLNYNATDTLFSSFLNGRSKNKTDWGEFGSEVHSWHFMYRLRTKNWFWLHNKYWNSYIYTQVALHMFLHCTLTNNACSSISNNMHKMIIYRSTLSFSKGLRILFKALRLAKFSVYFNWNHKRFNVKKL